MDNLKFKKNNYIEKWYLGYLCQGILVLGTIPILLPIIVEHYTDDAIAGIVVAMFYGGQLTAPFWGKIADSTRNLGLFYLLGYIMLGVGTFFFTFLQNEAFWILLALLQGMGAGSTNTVAAMFIVEFKPKKEWNSRIGWLQCFYGIGQASGLAIAAVLTLSPSIGLIISGLIMIPGFILGQNKNLPEEKHKHAPEAGAHLANVHTNLTHPFTLLSHFHPPTLESLGHFAKNWKNSFGLFILIWMLNNISRGLIYALYPLLMKKVFGIHPGISSLYYAFGAGLCIFLYFPAGKLSNKLQSIKVSFIGLCISTLGIILMSIFAFIPGNFSYFAAPTSFLLLLISWAPLIVAGTTTVSEIAPIPEGSAIGIFNSTMAVGIVFSALLAGAIGLNIGYRVVLILAAVVSIFAVALFLYLLFTQNKNETKSKN